MLWLACCIGVVALAVLGLVLRRRGPRDADLIMRRERAMVALADINRDRPHPDVPPPDLHEADVQSVHVTILNPDSPHLTPRPSSRLRTQSKRSVKPEARDLTNRPTVAHLPSLPGTPN